MKIDENTDSFKAINGKIIVYSRSMNEIVSSQKEH